MDLKLKDVAELLNVSEATIRRWITEGKIPYYRLNHQFRFSRSEVESWVLSCKQGGDFSAFNQEAQSPFSENKERLGSQQYGLYRAIYKGGVYHDIPGEEKEEVIRAAMEKIAHELHLDAEVLTELLLDREHLMPTALSSGVAVPHTRDFLLQDSYDVVAVAFLKKPVEYGALDGEKVHTLFFLFACDDKRHLHLLAKLAHLVNKEENLAFLKKRPSKAGLLEYIKNWEGHLKVGDRSRKASSVVVRADPDF